MNREEGFNVQKESKNSSVNFCSTKKIRRNERCGFKDLENVQNVPYHKKR